MKMKFITGLLLVISTLKGFSQENENPPLEKEIQNEIIKQLNEQLKKTFEENS